MFFALRTCRVRRFRTTERRDGFTLNSLNEPRVCRGLRPEQSKHPFGSRIREAVSYDRQASRPRQHPIRDERNTNPAVNEYSDCIQRVEFDAIVGPDSLLLQITQSRR